MCCSRAAPTPNNIATDSGSSRVARLRLSRNAEAITPWSNGRQHVTAVRPGRFYCSITATIRTKGLRQYCFRVRRTQRKGVVNVTHRNSMNVPNRECAAKLPLYRHFFWRGRQKVRTFSGWKLGDVTECQYEVHYRFRRLFKASEVRL